MSRSTAIIQRTVSLLCPDKEGKAQIEDAAAALGVHTTTLYTWLKYGLQKSNAESLAKIIHLRSDLGDPLTPDEILDLTRAPTENTITPG